MGQFLYAAKAFDVVERLDPNPEFWEGKRGAVVGVFQQVVAGRENSDALIEALGLLRGAEQPEAKKIEKIIAKWCQENDILI